MSHVHLPFTPDWLFWPQPWVWALAAIPLLPLYLLLWRRRSNQPAIRFSGVASLRAAAGRWPRRFRVLLPVLRTLALACLLVAVARPEKADESSRQFAEGVAIQLVVDTSSSMEDDDLSEPNQPRTRLDVVKEVVHQFVEGDSELSGRKSDLIGLIRFARFADSTCPLTLDHANLLEALKSTKIVGEEMRAEVRELQSRRRLTDADERRLSQLYQRYPKEVQPEDGTAIGNGLALAVERLKDLQRTAGSGQTLKIASRVVILLTDGENNAGEVSPKEAGELAATHKVKVYTIMAGSGERTRVGRRPVDDSLLREIATLTGGKHFTARDAKALAEVYREIDALERTKIEERHYLRYGELGRPWLLAAFVLICVQMFADATWLRKIP